MVANLIGPNWVRPDRETLPVLDPATGDAFDEVPLSGAAEVDAAVDAARRAYESWSTTPLTDRVQLMFRLKARLEDRFEELAALITRQHGKTLAESRGELRRGIEVVDFSCSAPTLLQGRTLRQVTREVDQDLFRYPVGVVAGITPFNFPLMIPLWMVPIAVVAGNTFVLKASERTPLGASALGELFLSAGFPPGVLNVVHGATDAVNALLRHPGIDAISFVGSEAVARYVYAEAARNGKRVQSAGGAKNYIVVMPDADMKAAVPAILNSAFGNAGERCLAGSVMVGVGGAHQRILDDVAAGAARLVVGPGDREGVDIGPLIRDDHRRNVIRHIEAGLAAGARSVVDGRPYAQGRGFFLGPTILDGVRPGQQIASDEVFGPVLSAMRADDLDDAIALAGRVAYGNMATIFTSSGRAARQFREQVPAGMIGVNVGVAQPFAFFPFSGWRASFFGDLHLHGTDGFEFYTRKKMLVSRWD